MWGGDAVRVAVSLPTYAAQEGSRREIALGGHAPLEEIQMAFPTRGGSREFLVKGCQGQAEMRTAMRVHFLYRHVWYTLIILEDGNLPHPR